MKKNYEIIIHARAGQGAKSAAHFIAAAAAKEGKYVQAFPSYGPERNGAPMAAFVRISDKPILVHSNIYSPDLAIVIDPTLLKSKSLRENWLPGTVLVVNSGKSAHDIQEELDLSSRVVALDVSDISYEIFGKNLPNTMMIAVAASLLKFVDNDILRSVVQDFFTQKYNEKIGDQNYLAMQRAEGIVDE